MSIQSALPSLTKFVASFRCPGLPAAQPTPPQAPRVGCPASFEAQPRALWRAPYESDWLFSLSWLKWLNEYAREKLMCNLLFGPVWKVLCGYDNDVWCG